MNSRVLLFLVNTWIFVLTTAGCLKALMCVASFVTSNEHLDICVHYNRMFKSTNMSSRVLLLLVNTWIFVFTTAGCLKALMCVAGCCYF